MPTALRIGAYRFFFFAGDRGEPPHIHVERSSDKAKFWLEPVRLQKSSGFADHELNRLQRLVTINQQRLLQAWNEYFDPNS